MCVGNCEKCAWVDCENNSFHNSHNDIYYDCDKCAWVQSHEIRKGMESWNIEKVKFIRYWSGS